jgi:hypothetical protein
MKTLCDNGDVIIIAGQLSLSHVHPDGVVGHGMLRRWPLSEVCAV